VLAFPDSIIASSEVDLPDLVDKFRRWLATSLVRLAERSLEQGAPRRAAEMLAESFSLFARCEDRQGLLLCLDRLSVTAASQQQFDRAVHLYAVASGLRELHVLPDRRTGVARDHEAATFDVAREQLGRRTVAAITQSARWLARQCARSTADGNLARLLEYLEPRSIGPALTAREWEVAMLVAEGKTNAQIAEALVISRGTVMTHVKHILHRLGMSSRAQIAAWVAQQAIA
jgi:non-specific serine/threonine protein kinase